MAQSIKFNGNTFIDTDGIFHHYSGQTLADILNNRYPVFEYYGNASGQTVPLTNVWHTYLVISSYTTKIGAWLVLPKGNKIITLGSELTTPPFTCNSADGSITFSGELGILNILILRVGRS